MKAQKECFACLQDQARRWSENIAHSYVQTLKRDENGVSAFPPPYLAITLYSLLSQERGVQDLYEQIKLQCIKKAHKLLQGIDPLVLSPKEGIEFAVMGNVIDYGSASSFEIENFDLQKEREKSLSLLALSLRNLSKNFTMQRKLSSLQITLGKIFLMS